MFWLVSCITCISAKANFWPYPKLLKEGSFVKLAPCDVTFHVDSKAPHVQELVDHYRSKVFKCAKMEGAGFELEVKLKNDTLLAPLKGREGYSLNLSAATGVMSADFYPGFVRAIETFSQAFYDGGVDLPLQIIDNPDLEIRGVMLDSSRHFISLSSLKRILDGMMYSKMNVLHWHIFDQDFFPLEVPRLPNISRFGACGNQTYSPGQVKEVIDYALSRAVRVIPEADTPAHSRSWGRSLNESDFIMACGEPYFGQMDVSMVKAYNWTQEILNYVVEKFPDELLHMGG